MKLRFPFVFLCAAALWAQAPGPAPSAAPAQAPANPAGAAPQGAPPQGPAVPALSTVMNMPDSAVFATANGKKMTAGEVKRIVQKIPPQQLPQVDARELLVQIALMNQFAADALNQKFDQRSPWKEELEGVRNQYLAGAWVNDVRANMKPASDEVQKYYDANKNRYEQAKIKLIYFPFAENPAAQADPNAKKQPAEPEAKAKAEAVLKELRAGGDFVKAVQQYSEDPVSKAKNGDFGQPLRRTDNIPENIKTAVFAAKPGQISDIIRQPNGFYIFRTEEVGLQPLDKVRDQVTQELTESKFQDWMQKTRAGMHIAFEPGPANASPSAQQAGPPAGGR